MKVTLDIVFTDASGLFGRYYFRHFNGNLYMARRPNYSNYKPSAKQLEVRKKFKENFVKQSNVI